MEAVRFTITGTSPKNCIRAGHEMAEIETVLENNTIDYEKRHNGTVIRMNGEQITAKKLFSIKNSYRKNDG